MRFTFVFILFLFTLLGCTTQPDAVPDSRQNDYALYDHNGDFHRLSRYNNSKAIVLWVQGNGCPIVRNALTDFHTLISDFSEADITFFMLNSNLQDTRSSIAAEASDFNFQVPVLVDSAQLLADALDLSLTAEAIVLHPSTREILYRGPINNRLDYEAVKNEASESYLRDALAAILKGEAVNSKQQMARGCTVTRLSKTQPNDALTYTQDIAPILANNCVNCHRKDGIAPWAMTDYQTIYGWSATIKEVLLSKRMPPWKADPEIGAFSNSFAMADSNARKLVSWIDNGMPAGEGNDPLVGLPLPATDWTAGEPDEIAVLKEQAIPASKIIPYRYQKIPLKITEDTWLRGVEIKAGNAKVVHHIVLTNTESTGKNIITSREERPWTDNYIALSSGAGQTTIFPEGTGILLKKGTVLTVQLHYTTTGKPETDETRIGFYYHKEPPAAEFYALAPSNIDFTIPPYTENTQLIVSDSIERDINIHYIAPHMHYRGKSIKFSVISPSEEKKTLISISDYNFNWQWIYKLEEPIFVPKGSKVLVEGIFDNSFQNPLNPDPSQELHYGVQSTDEMLIGFFNYTLAD